MSSSFEKELNINHYRPDIDGLRAIAVISVVLFHFFPKNFQAGFVGVDIFFVISGYLISRNILSDLNGGNFSFLNFYSKRFKRILPALILLMIFTAVLGWFFLYSLEYKELSKHILGGLTFSSNFLLWREVGYFDSKADSKILLHLWSLGIEEQFYFITPFLYFLLYRFKKKILWPLVVFTVFSFLLNLHYLNKDSSFVFYLPVFRFWELLIGCVLAAIFAVENNKLEKFKLGRESLFSFFGLFLIVFSLVFFNKTQPFPGWRALLPTLGAFLIIFAGLKGWVNRYVLSNKVLVGVGLISFSLYLWHWPLLVYLNIFYEGEIPFLGRILLVFVSVVFSYLSWRYIEVPFRKAKVVFSIIWVLFFALFLFSFFVYKKDGMSSRLSEEMQLTSIAWDKKIVSENDCLERNNFLLDEKIDFCLESDPGNRQKVALLGDSHAHHFYPALVTFFKPSSVLLLGKSACPPLLGISLTSKDTRNSHCEELFAKNLDSVLKNSDIHTVVLAARWPIYFSLSGFGEAEEKEAANLSFALTYKKSEIKNENRVMALQLALDQTIKRIALSGKKIFFIYSVPELGFDPKSCVKRPFSLGRQESQCVLLAAEVQKRVALYRNAIEIVLKKYPSISKIDPIDYFCDSKTCSIKKDDLFLYRDDDHLSFFGSQWFGNELTKRHFFYEKK